MNLALVFRISGVLLILNGISMFFTPAMAVGMYGLEESGSVIVMVRALGISFLATGVLALMLPTWIETKLAADGMLWGVINLAWVAHIGYDIYTANISGGAAVANLILTAILAILFFVMSSRHSN